jgi:dipeptidyl aminopeptidase/acylaminoacyl peptidase
MSLSILAARLLRFKLPLIACLVFTMTIPSSLAQETPILDRNLFFGNPQISGGQLSPDGKTISFMKAYNGIMNIWVKDFDAPFDEALPVTDSQRPLMGYAWTDDGKYILYIKDKDGDENLNVFAVDPKAAAPDKIPESRNLTPLKDVTAQLVHVSQKNPDLLWVGLNDRDKAWHDLYQLTISTGELKLLYKNEDRITGYEFDWDDNLRLLSRTDEKGTTTLLRKDADDLVPIYDTLVTEGASVIGWTPDNKKIYLETNKGELDLSSVFLMDPETLEMTLFESDPEKRVDFGSLQLDQNTRKPISTSYVDDKVRYYWKDPVWEANYNFLVDKFPGREISFQSSTKDYSKFLVAVSGDRFASEAWFFDAQTKELIFQYTPRPELKEVEQYLAPMLPIRYPSSDGLEIPGYLTLPVGKQPQNLPMVVVVHGGPKGPRDTWGYDPEAQFLANRGYAVLQPNFRASGGYGKAFLNAGDGEWGKLMQDDITWGVKHLIEQGTVDKSRVAIMGGSYGGYATLAGLAFTPDLYACGVDIVGPSNIFTLLDSIPAYWEAGRAFLYGMVGDPNTDEGKARIQEASPLFSASRIQKPLLIIQGANDPRVKQAEADQIAIALRDRGHDVSYLLAEDEGHGFAKPVNRMAMYAEVERFLADKIGGRYQESMPEDVAKRLEELRVDISKVTYVNPKDIAIADALPEITPALKEGTEEWKVKISVQGQELAMKTTRTITKSGDTWLIKDSTVGPLGNMTDSATYSAGLTPLTRSLSEGDQLLTASFSPNRITLTKGGESQDMEYTGALLCDGPGRDFIISGMTLAYDMNLVVNVADMQTGKVQPMRIQVAGNEDWEGAALTKVTLTNLEMPAQKTTLWIDPTTKTVRKSQQVLPQLGDAVLEYVRSN